MLFWPSGLSLWVGVAALITCCLGCQLFVVAVTHTTASLLAQATTMEGGTTRSVYAEDSLSPSSEEGPHPAFGPKVEPLFCTPTGYADVRLGHIPYRQLVLVRLERGHQAPREHSFANNIATVDGLLGRGGALVLIDSSAVTLTSVPAGY